MSASLRAHRAGLTLGASLGLFHLLWCLLIALHLAQPIINFVFKLHRIDPPYTVLPFSFGLALALVLMASFSGYIIGVVIGGLWELTKNSD